METTWLLPPPQCTKSLVVVLDLDATLIEMTRHKYLSPEEKLDYEFVISNKEIREEWGYSRAWEQMAVCVRPQLTNFLKEVSKFAEIVLWTLGCEEYARGVLRRIDKHRNISGFVCRDEIEDIWRSFYFSLPPQKTSRFGHGSTSPSSCQENCPPESCDSFVSSSSLESDTSFTWDMRHCWSTTMPTTLRYIPEDLKRHFFFGRIERQRDRFGSALHVTKDLFLLGRELSKCVLVEDSSSSCLLNPFQSVLVPEFRGGSEEFDGPVLLSNVLPKLKRVMSSPDVRQKSIDSMSQKRVCHELLCRVTADLNESHKHVYLCRPLTSGPFASSWETMYCDDDTLSFDGECSSHLPSLSLAPRPTAKKTIPGRKSAPPSLPCPPDCPQCMPSASGVKRPAMGPVGVVVPDGRPPICLQRLIRLSKKVLGFDWDCPVFLFAMRGSCVDEHGQLSTGSIASSPAPRPGHGCPSRYLHSVDSLDNHHESLEDITLRLPTRALPLVPSTPGREKRSDVFARVTLTPVQDVGCLRSGQVLCCVSADELRQLRPFCECGSCSSRPMANDPLLDHLKRHHGAQLFPPHGLIPEGVIRPYREDDDMWHCIFATACGDNLHLGVAAQNEVYTEMMIATANRLLRMYTSITSLVTARRQQESAILIDGVPERSAEQQNRRKAAQAQAQAQHGSRGNSASSEASSSEAATTARLAQMSIHNVPTKMVASATQGSSSQPCSSVTTRSPPPTRLSDRPDQSQSQENVVQPLGSRSTISAKPKTKSSAKGASSAGSSGDGAGVKSAPFSSRPRTRSMTKATSGAGGGRGGSATARGGVALGLRPRAAKVSTRRTQVR